MEAKLESYRAKKRREAIINKFKEKFYNMVSFQQIRSDKSDHVIIDTTGADKSKTQVIATLSDNDEDLDDTCSTASVTESITSSNLDDTEERSTIAEIAPTSTLFRYFTYILYSLFWATCYAIAIELQFGLVFLVLSALIGIFLNTRTGPKKKNEISAYSVFNKDCHSIDGTLKAEQFEAELRYGALHIK